MLGVPFGNRFAFRYKNFSTPSTSPGTGVTPGASNAEGSWTQIASSANIAQDIYLVAIKIAAGSTSGQAKAHLLDIGIDPAGGTSYTAIVSNIACGSSSTYLGGGCYEFVFPLFIKAGSSVAVRIQGVNATAGTVRISASFYGRPTRPELIRVGRYSETIGTITGSEGVSFTPGNGAEGSWVSLGTTSRPLWWWQLGVQISQATQSALVTNVDLAYGDSSNKHPIIEDLTVHTSTAEGSSIHHHDQLIEGFMEVPAGGELFVRGRCSGAPNSGWSAVAIGIGG